MRTGIAIGIQGSTPRASDAAVQSFQGKASGAGAETDLIITIDTSTATSRLNSDGNYYTITFPDDFIGTRGTADDAFKFARVGTGAISLPATANLDVILNIPVGMKLGANTANSIIINEVNRSDPALYFKFNTSDWTEDILARLNITVNNYGMLIGAGGSGGWGGVFITGSKTLTYPGQGGAGGGQGLHPEHGGTAVTSFRDPNDSGILPAGQAGSGFGKWIGGLSAYGVQGTPDAGGSAGAQVSDGGATPNLRGGAGSYGGHIIYCVSDVSTVITGTHINIHNNGWMSAGCGGGAGDQTGGSSGRGGDWTLNPYGTAAWLGGGYPGNQITGGGSVEFGGVAGRIIANTSNPNLILSNTVVNNSANTIYGWYEVIAPA